jgi:hypothetical protein
MTGSLTSSARPVFAAAECAEAERIAEAFKYVEQGHKKSNVVIMVAHS